MVEGQLVIEVQVTGEHTESAKIERILRAVGSKPLTLQEDALDFAGSLVLPTFAIAGLAAFLTGDFTRAICILITDFGTGFRVALPVTALTAMTLASREGILIKGAQYMERLSKADVVVFDKTGTLTHGVPHVVEWVTKNFNEPELIRLAASAEAEYDHPVARALKTFAKEKQILLTKPKPGSEKYAVGLGLSAVVNGHRVRLGRAKWMKSQGLKTNHFKREIDRFRKDAVSTLCVAVDEKVVGLIAYSDGTRPESRMIVKRLRANGRRKIVLLSGDNAEVVKKVAAELGIDEAMGGLLPADKAKYVRNLKKQGSIVAMVGDGINDVPALALADVGISLDGSSEIALETADVILLGEGLLRLVKTFNLSDEAMVRIRENLGLIVVPNAVAIFLGAFGYLSPTIAALANNGITILAALIGTSPLLQSKPDPVSTGTTEMAQSPTRDAPHSAYPS